MCTLFESVKATVRRLVQLTSDVCTWEGDIEIVFWCVCLFCVSWSV